MLCVMAPFSVILTGMSAPATDSSVVTARPSQAVARQKWLRKRCPRCLPSSVLRRQMAGQSAPPQATRQTCSASVRSDCLPSCRKFCQTASQLHPSFGCRWFLSNGVRNRRTHATHGNIVGKPSRRLSATRPASPAVGHTQPCTTNPVTGAAANRSHTRFSVATLNFGGTHTTHKWTAVRAMPYGILVFTETQLQTHIFQSVKYEFPHHHCFHSVGFFQGITPVLRFLSRNLVLGMSSPSSGSRSLLASAFTRTIASMRFRFLLAMAV